MKAVFVLGGFEPSAVERGKVLTDRMADLLERAADVVGLTETTVVFAVEDEFLAHQRKTSKQDIGIARIREERPRVLQEIVEAAPDFIMCFGPVAAASVFDKGNLTEDFLLRKAHFPLTSPFEKLPVYYTYSLENIRYKAGLEQWVELDLRAAVEGRAETVWGEYVVLQPDDGDWHRFPADLFPPFKFKVDNLEWQDLMPPGTAIPVKDVNSVTFLHVSPQTIGFDLETFPAISPWDENARIRMAIISDQVGRAWVIQATPDSQLPDWVTQLAASPHIIKAGSNIKFDALWMKRFGYELNNMWDTSTHEHVIDESNPIKNLKGLTFKYVPKLGDYSYEQRVLAKSYKGDWSRIKDEEMYQYAGGDGEASIGAYLGQAPEIERLGLDRPARLFRNLYDVLVDIEFNGCAIDVAANRELDQLYRARMRASMEEITKVLGPVNPNSPPQLANALKAAVPSINLSKSEMRRVLGDGEDTEVSTKREVLQRESHKHPVIAQVLEFRRMRTRFSTFIDKVYEKHLHEHDGCHFIHPHFRTDVVETYRLSSRDPNGQNMPRVERCDQCRAEDASCEPCRVSSIKRQFVSRWPGGSILDVDQRQVELRVAAMLSGDKAMRAAVESGEDIHLSMAKMMLGKDTISDDERTQCKTQTFLILYGGGAKKLARDLGIGVGTAQSMIADYYRSFPGLRRYIDKCRRVVQADLQVETPFGFRRRFVQPEQWNSPDGWGVQRQAFNTMIQNTAVCVTYCAMIWMQAQLREQGLKSLMINQVHDSVVFDVYPGEEDAMRELARAGMEEAAVQVALDYGVTIDVPLKADVKIGPNWGECK